MAENLGYAWSPDVNSSYRQLHNNYAKNLIICYLSKFTQLSTTLIDSVEKEDYLIYALTGRSLIECTATLRYYMLLQYKPILDKKSLSLSDIKQLIDIDDRHLRGGRFDWESFLFKDYEKLKNAAVKHLTSKEAKQKNVAKTIISEQINVLTCIEKWAKDTPQVLIIYNLFCDLVHPNIGSSFLIASTDGQHLYFNQSKDKSIGLGIFEQSFPFLVSMTHKPFGDYLFMLISTIYQDDEL